ncbi:MAG: hypothetical protein WDW38_000002 [Sanguina aurantia]
MPPVPECLAQGVHHGWCISGHNLACTFHHRPPPPPLCTAQDAGSAARLQVWEELCSAAVAALQRLQLSLRAPVPAPTSTHAGPAGRHASAPPHTPPWPHSHQQQHHQHPQHHASTQQPPTQQQQQQQPPTQQQEQQQQQQQEQQQQQHHASTQQQQQQQEQQQQQQRSSTQFPPPPSARTAIADSMSASAGGGVLEVNVSGTLLYIDTALLQPLHHSRLYRLLVSESAVTPRDPQGRIYLPYDSRCLAAVFAHLQEMHLFGESDTTPADWSEIFGPRLPYLRRLVVHLGLADLILSDTACTRPGPLAQAWPVSAGPRRSPHDAHAAAHAAAVSEGATPHISQHMLGSPRSFSNHEQQ